MPPVESLPPSCKTVFVVLRQSGPLTRDELATKSMLSESTLTYAIERLRESGAIRVECVVGDSRKRRYSLAD